MTGNADAAEIILGNENPWWLVLTAGALLGPLFSLYKIFKWSANSWSTHPIAESLAVYCNNNTTWLAVAADINIEFRRLLTPIIFTIIKNNSIFETMLINFLF